ncbi:SAM-dependent methyltransferase [Rhizobium tibeticum]|uniref:class I SAM-dependent methyltransferase n=1 Tax=Rhizobium tibeticum TaxID=501024 RepID=UPI00277EC2B6|nr:class I SAM-dependent methyltransferase [Rhizobium tibeticum]MDP9813442.1 SAM-dependent methyltransferase [Rhizobium tibeticum]
MNESEFDQFADEYRKLHANVITASGETPEFFAEYKIADMARHAASRSVEVNSILDFGCGVGTSSPYFLRYFPDASLVGVDVSNKSLEIARSRFGQKATYAQLDKIIGFPDNTFDTAFAACVFHHIPWEEHEHWLREIHRVVKPSGFVAIFEHNPWNPLTVRAVNTCEFDANARLMNPFHLRTLLRGVGWNKVRHDYRIFFPRALSSFRFLEAGMRWLPLGAQFSVTAQK